MVPPRHPAREPGHQAIGVRYLRRLQAAPAWVWWGVAASLLGPWVVRYWLWGIGTCVEFLSVR